MWGEVPQGAPWAHGPTHTSGPPATRRRPDERTHVPTHSTDAALSASPPLSAPRSAPAAWSRCSGLGGQVNALDATPAKFEPVVPDDLDLSDLTEPTLPEVPTLDVPIATLPEGPDDPIFDGPIVTIPDDPTVRSSTARS